MSLSQSTSKQLSDTLAMFLGRQDNMLQLQLKMSVQHDERLFHVRNVACDVLLRNRVEKKLQQSKNVVIFNLGLILFLQSFHILLKKNK